MSTTEDIKVEQSKALQWVMERFNGKNFKCGNHTKLYWNLRKELTDLMEYTQGDKYNFYGGMQYNDSYIYLKYNDYEFVLETI